MFITKLNPKIVRYFLFPFFICFTSICIIVNHNMYNGVVSHWKIALTMFFGSLIAGSTAEGGAAIAFPVMTLILDIPPHVARDFGLSIQSIGMVSATFFIFQNKIDFIRGILLRTLTGSFIGLNIGFYFLDSIMAPDQIKFLFTGVWQSFSLALLIIYLKKPQRNDRSSNLNVSFFFLLGIMGGIISSLVGSGIDIIIFTFLCLRHNVSPKIATPTSVILMSGTSLMGAFLKHFFYEGLSPRIYPMVLAASFVVVIGAPLGAWLIKHISNFYILILLLISITLQSVWAIFILPLSSINLFTFGMSFFVGGLICYLLNASSEE